MVVVVKTFEENLTGAILQPFFMSTSRKEGNRRSNKNQEVGPKTEEIGVEDALLFAVACGCLCRSIVQSRQHSAHGSSQHQPSEDDWIKNGTRTR